MKLYTSSFDLKKVKPSDVTISVYGLGKMGLPLAVVFADAGFSVIGVDVNKQTVEDVNKGINPVTSEKNLSKMLKDVVKKKRFSATIDRIEAAKQSDIKVILIPIFIDKQNKPDLSILSDVIENIAKGLQKGDIVILESSAPPGTTLNVIGKRLEQLSGFKLNKDFGIAHCPERISSGTAIEDIQGRLCPKVVGGSDQKTTKIAEFIYKKINKLPVIPVSDPTTAEMVKLSGEIYRDVNIAYANSLYLQCNELGVDASEVIRVSNTNPYSNILVPGPGVGGHCIPVYPYFILNTTKKNQVLLKTVRKINDAMPNHVIDLIAKVLHEKGKELVKADVLVLGIAYRAEVKELRKSPGLEIAHLLKDLAKTVYVYDPLFTKKEITDLGFTYKKDFTDVDCIVITTNEEEFKKLDWRDVSNHMRTKTVVDTKNIIKYEQLSSLGFSMRRIGYAK